MSLKMSCLQTTGGDVKKAKELYEFLAEGVNAMPDYDVQPPSVMEQAKNTFNGIFGWVKENQGDIVQAWNFIRQVRGGEVIQQAAQVTSEVPPIPKP